MIDSQLDEESVSWQKVKLEEKKSRWMTHELIVHRELYANTMIHLYRVHRRINEDQWGVRAKIDSKNQELTFEELGS